MKLEPLVAEPDFEAMDEMATWAVEHAAELAALDAKAREPK